MRSGEDDEAKNFENLYFRFGEKDAFISADLRPSCFTALLAGLDQACHAWHSTARRPALDPVHVLSMPNAKCGAVMVSARWKKTASKTAKHGGASRASAALGRSARQPFTAESHARLRDAIIAVQTDWADAHGRVSKAALCEADEDAVEDAQKACQTLREEGGMGWMARVRVVKRGNRHWEEDSAVLHHQLVGMVCDGRTAGAGGMQIDDHWKIVGTGFNTDPQDAMEPDGRHAGIPFVVGARRVSAAVAGTDQEVHSYVFMLQVDKHERCSLEVLLAMPDWASISGDGSVHQQSRWRTLTSALDLLTPGADKDQQDMVRFGVVRKFPNAKGEDQGPIWHTIDYAFGKDQHNAYNNECCRMLALHRGNMGPGGVLKWANYTGVKACAHCGGTAHELHCISGQEHLRRGAVPQLRSTSCDAVISHGCALIHVGASPDTYTNQWESDEWLNRGGRPTKTWSKVCHMRARLRHYDLLATASQIDAVDDAGALAHAKWEVSWFRDCHENWLDKLTRFHSYPDHRCYRCYAFLLRPCPW